MGIYRLPGPFCRWHQAVTRSRKLPRHAKRQPEAVMPDFFKAGGTLSATAPSYIRRQADDELYRALLDGEFCYVLSSRQVGKSSLVYQTIARLKQEGVATVNIDLTAIGTGNTREQWYFGLLDILGRQLGLQTEVEAFLDTHERLDPLHLWMQTLESIVLAR